MAEQISSRRDRRPALATAYIAVWGLLASLALGYLALLAVRPDLAAGFSLRPAIGAPENNRSQRSMSKALAELGLAKSAIARLEDETRELRSALSAQEQRGLTIEARLGAIETSQKTASAPVAQSFPVSQRAGGDRAGAAAQPGPASGQYLAGHTTEGTIEERPTRVLREGRPPVAVAGATGSATKPAEPAGPPAGLLLASGPSLDAVRLSWQLLNEGNRSTLRRFEPRYVEAADGGGLFQLIAGPAGTPEEASRVCERLKTKQVRCSVTTFKGQPL